MPSSTVENYLKELFLQQQELESSYVPMNVLALAMDVTAGTATVMVQGLAEEGFVDYQKRVGSRLTSRGEQEALQVLRRHRLVEAFLVKILGLDWSEVHEEAHLLEHVVSERVLERMDTLLGHPETDPHGDPIPSASGSIDRTSYISLAEAPLNERFRVVRILDQSPEFLRYLESKGIGPGAQVVVEAGGDVSGAFTVRPQNLPPTVLGKMAAESILVD
ncbi:MAG: metal-dependent transcriptional regulator [Treponemataceae bacterium]